MLRVTRCTPVLASCWQSSETSTNSVFSERGSGWFCAIAIAVDSIAVSPQQLFAENLRRACNQIVVDRSSAGAAWPRRNESLRKP